MSLLPLLNNNASPLASDHVNLRVHKPRPLGHFPLLNMSMVRRRSFRILLELVFISLIAISTQNPVDHLESDSIIHHPQYALQKSPNIPVDEQPLTVDDSSTASQEAHDQHMKWLKSSAAWGWDTRTGREAVSAMRALLDNEHTPASDLDMIVADAGMNDVAGEAVRRNLRSAMDDSRRLNRPVEDHAGRPVLLANYRFILDHRDGSVVTECLKMVNILINAPFSHWAEELGARDFAKEMADWSKYGIPKADADDYNAALSYFDYIVGSMRDTRLADTPQFRSVATLRAALQSTSEALHRMEDPW